MTIWSRLAAWFRAPEHDPNAPFYVEFDAPDGAAYERLARMVDALAAAKVQNTFEAYDWGSYFDEAQLARFLQPAAGDRAASSARWYATPRQLRGSDPSVQNPWDFDSLIGAFEDGEFEQLRLQRVNLSRARLEWVPQCFPYGGSECFFVLVACFGFCVLRVEE